MVTSRLSRGRHGGGCGEGSHPENAGAHAQQQDPAAAILGISLKTLHNKLKEYGYAEGE